MSMIGYSHLMKDILDVDKTSVELLLEKVSGHHTSDLRIKVLRQLAIAQKETISGLLKSVGAHNTGGTYKAILSFFSALQKDNIVSSNRCGKRTYWQFTEISSDLARYFIGS